MRRGSFLISHSSRRVNFAAQLGGATPWLEEQQGFFLILGFQGCPGAGESSIWCSQCALLCPGTAPRARWKRNHPGRQKNPEGCYLTAFGQGKATSQEEHDVPRHLLLNDLPVQEGWRCPELCPAPWNPKEILCKATLHFPKKGELAGRRVWSEPQESLLSALSGITQQRLGAPPTKLLKLDLQKP